MSTDGSGGESEHDSTNSGAGVLAGSFPHLLATAAIQRTLSSRRRLQFNPLPGRGPARQVPPKQPHNMATAARADLRVKFASFSGTSKEDPDCHVAQFETRWQARGFAGVYDAQAKMRQFEATLEGKAMQWFNNFVAGHFVDYDALRIAFLNRFRKEKTANDVLTKLKGVKQKKMFVEDYSQKFNRYVRRLTAQERPTDEMLAAYFVKGLRRELQNAVAGVDVATRMGALIDTATRAEKRFGLSGSSSEKKCSKRRKDKKKKRSSDDSSDDDSEAGSDTDSDSNSEASTDSDSDSDSDFKKEDKKRKHKKKAREKAKGSLVQKMVEKKLKEMGVKQESAGSKKVHCDICDKDGHLTSNCWYNPNYRGQVPERVQQKIQQNLAQASGVFPDSSGKQRSFNNSGWQRQQQPFSGWRLSFNQNRPFRPNFNEGFRPRFGRFQNSRPWGGNWNQPQGWNQQQGWQQPPNWNQQNWNQQNWNQPNLNQQGWNQQPPNQNLPQLPAPPVQQGEAEKAPQSNMIEVEIFQEHGVNQVSVDCSPECDCSQCKPSDPEVLAVTLSKAKLKPPLDWEEQKEIRNEVIEEVEKSEDEEMTSIRKNNQAKRMESSEMTSGALFEVLLNTPMHFTLDQLLSLVPIFRDRLYSVTRRSAVPKLQSALKENAESYQISPDDVDFTIPTVQLEFDGRIFSDVLLDGGSGVNILAETEFSKMTNVKLEPAPFQVRMADQRRVQPIGMLRGQTLKVHGMSFQTNFVVLKMQDAGNAYSMLLGRPWFKSAKLKQDWENNEVILKKGGKTVRIPMTSKKKLATSAKPMMAQTINLAAEVEDDEEEYFWKLILVWYLYLKLMWKGLSNCMSFRRNLGSQ